MCCVALAIVVIELIIWAIGWALKIAIGLAIVAGVVVGGGMLLAWLFTKLWPLLIFGAIVGLVIVAVRLRSRFRGYSSRRDNDRHDSGAPPPQFLQAFAITRHLCLEYIRQQSICTRWGGNYLDSPQKYVPFCLNR